MTEIVQIIHIRMYLALSNQQRLIFHKTQTTNLNLIQHDHPKINLVSHTAND